MVVVFVEMTRRKDFFEGPQGRVDTDYVYLEGAIPDIPGILKETCPASGILKVDTRVF